MQMILKVIDTLSEKFSSSWTSDKMPGWMKKLFDSYSADGSQNEPELSFSAKLFILKLIINRSNVFQPYANFWFTHLADYVVSKETGGKGLHYFLRDICVILINFSDNINLKSNSIENQEDESSSLIVHKK